MEWLVVVGGLAVAWLAVVVVVGIGLAAAGRDPWLDGTREPW